MSTGKNNSTVLTTTRQGGLDQFPPEFLASTLVTTLVRDGVNLDVALATLSSTIVGAKLEHERTNERKETVDVIDLSGVTIRDVVTDPETGVSVEVIKTIVAAGSAGNGGIDGSGYYVDVKALSDDWAVLIKSRVVAASLTSAAYTFTTYIDFNLPDVLIAIDSFADAGSTSTDNSGTFTQVTWRTGFSWGYEAAVRIRHYDRKVKATVAVSFGTDPTTLVPATIQKFILSSGTIVAKEGSYDQVFSQSTDPAGTSITTSNSTKYSAITIPPVITNGITTQELVAPTTFTAGANLKLDASTPAVMPDPGDTFVGDSIVSKGRLGIYEKRTFTITMP